MTPLRLVWLALALWGAIHPMYWFVTHMQETGTGLGGLIDAWYVNASTTGLTWDLTIAAITLTVWIIAESGRRKDWLALIAFFFASALVGRSAGTQKFRDQSAKWKTVVLVLAAVIIAMSGFVKVRDNRKATEGKAPAAAATAAPDQASD